jgi:hypothetical protein
MASADAYQYQYNNQPGLEVVQQPHYNDVSGLEVARPDLGWLHPVHVEHESNKPGSDSVLSSRPEDTKYQGSGREFVAVVEKEEEKEEKQQQWWSRKRTWIMVAVACIIIIGAVVGAVVGTRPRDPASPATNSK